MSGLLADAGVFDFGRSSGFRSVAEAAGDASIFGASGVYEAHHVVPVQAFANTRIQDLIRDAGDELGRGFSLNTGENSLLLPKDILSQGAAQGGNPPVFAAMHSGSDGTHTKYNTFANARVAELADQFEGGDISAAQFFDRLDNLQSTLKQGLRTDNVEKALFFLDNNDGIMATKLAADPNSSTIAEFYENRLDAIGPRLDLSQPGTLEVLDGDIGVGFRYADNSVNPVLNSNISVDVAGRFNKVLDGSGVFEKLGIAVLAVGFIGQADDAMAGTYGDDYEMNDVMDFISKSNIPVDQLEEVLPDLAKGAAIDIGLSIAASMLGVGILWKAYELWESFDGLESAFDYASQNTDSAVIAEVSSSLTAIKTRLDSWFGSNETPTGRVELTEAEKIDAFTTLPQATQAKVLETLNAYLDLRFADGGHGTLIDALTAAQVYGATGAQGISFESILEAALALSDDAALYDLSGDMGFRECFPAGTLIDMWPTDADLRPLADGSYDTQTLRSHIWRKPIEEVTASDLVVSTDGKGRLVPGQVAQTFTNTTSDFVVLTFEDGRDDLVATLGHRFETATGDYMEIGQMLRLGGGQVRVVDLDGQIVQAVGEVVSYSAETAQMFAQGIGRTIAFAGNTLLKDTGGAGWQTYNFEVQTHHNYVAGQVRVHNDSILSKLQEFDRVLAVNEALTEVAVLRDVDQDGDLDVVVLEGARDAGGNADTRVLSTNVYLDQGQTYTLSTGGTGSLSAKVLDVLDQSYAATAFGSVLSTGGPDPWNNSGISDDFEEVLFDDVVGETGDEPATRGEVRALYSSTSPSVGGVELAAPDLSNVGDLLALQAALGGIATAFNGLNGTVTYAAGSGDQVEPPFEGLNGVSTLAFVLGLSLDYEFFPAVVVDGPFGPIEVTPAVTLGFVLGPLVEDQTQFDVVFGEGIAPADVSQTQEGDDLVLTIDNGDGTTSTQTLQGVYADQNADEVGSLIFADGTQVALADVPATVFGDGIVSGTAGNDTIDALYVDADSDVVSDAGDVIEAGAGDDLLAGGAGDDFYDGGAGNDTVALNDVWDTFDFVVGDAIAVTDTSTSEGVNEGIDTLVSIEAITFAGGATAAITEGAELTTIQFAAANGNTLARTVFDTAGLYAWYTYTVSYAADGVTKTDQVNTYDNGRILDIDYDASGVRTSQTMTDVENAYAWSEYTTTFAADGVTKIDQVNTYDNGRILDIDYDASGVRTSQTMTDVDNAYAWSEYTATFAADGVTKTNQVNTYDNGRILDIDYDASGVRTSQTMTDVDNAYAWSEYTATFAADGVTKTNQVNTYDNGRILDIDYGASGVRTSQTMTDVDNAYAWSEYTATFAADGVTKVDQVNTYDNGRTLDVDYDANGVRTSQTMIDNDNAYGWSEYTTTFGADGVTKTDQVNLYDNGRVLDVDFSATGIRASQTMTDVEDAYAWASYTQTFDDEGVLVDTTFVYDIA